MSSTLQRHNGRSGEKVQEAQGSNIFLPAARGNFAPPQENKAPGKGT